MAHWAHYAREVIALFVVLASCTLTFVRGLDGTCDEKDGFCVAKDLMQGDVILLVTEQQQTIVDKSKVQASVAKWKENGYSVVTTADLKLGSRAWAITGVLPEVEELWREKYPNKKWLLWLCDSGTVVNGTRLSEVLKDATTSPETDKVLVGRALRDSQSTAIHHYMAPGLEWPDCRCGFAMSRALVAALASQLRAKSPSDYFNIDPYHEFAKSTQAQDGTVIDNSRAFCYHDEAEAEECATVAPGPDVSLDDPDAPRIAETKLVIGVKTWSGNHGTRLPIVRRTWAKDAKTVIYFSDTDDQELHTVNAGPNTERGHCGKSLFALEHFRTHHPEASWYYLADDDTILSVPRLRALLARYSADGEEAMVIGERYGYGHNMISDRGYSYPTLGCGMAISRAALSRLLDGGFRCSARDSPDDMLIGMYLQGLGIPLVHNHGFHQEPPFSYAPAVIDNRGPHIAFHRFYNLEPDEVYRVYLGGKSDNTH